MAEDVMVRQYHQLSGQKFEQTPGDSEVQGSLSCCSPWGCRVRQDLATEQQQTNKELLYSTWNSTQYYVAAWMGGEFGQEWIYVYIWLSPLLFTYNYYNIVNHLCMLCMHATSLQSCPTLCDPIDGSPPGSSVPGILQARILEWVAISFSTSSINTKLLV